MKLIYLFCFFMLIAYPSFAQYEEAMKKLGENPIYLVDSTEISSEAFSKFDANRLTILTVYSGKEAKKWLGEKAKDGAIYMETIEFAQKRFMRFFKEKSKDYSKACEKYPNQTSFQYILNEKVLTGNFYGDLALVDKKKLKKITVIDSKELEQKYKVTGKDVGIVITKKEVKKP